MKRTRICTACLVLGLLVLSKSSSSQELQIHYDPRHSLDPAGNARNFVTLYFQYFRPAPDSATTFVKPGSFLLKVQTDLNGENNNMGKSYLQVSQSLRCWKPRIYLSLQYSGGLGVTEPKQYSYYIVNTFSAGAEVPFRFKGAWLSSVLNFKWVPYARPSHDFLYTFYWWRGFFQYRLEFAGDFSIWTENKDHGDGTTPADPGKRWYFFSEPQVWIHAGKYLALGSKINMYYHVNTNEDLLQAYPSLAVRVKW
ncbi:MAG: DUF5020 family protein [Bacteroidota bacterium]|nr:DUF5020 family protein [Bacteroidota bacterium]MDP4217693.1 DUF5020 family protein [Bacteroidota bacterium]MDP4246538.1 DUF5020 family protein [Bacteroidota bacterium]MDP4255649.1 DUF5020 family protein [Bacteroidota bacterium]MDP4260168.1 DUF5020 family protein [Bacteroidota bacterium]